MGSTMKSKTWKNVSEEDAERVKEFLLANNGVEDKNVKGIGEKWRVRLEKSVFTYYDKGTLFCNKASIEDIEKISKIIGEKIGTTEKHFLIGLDETGKGEVLGHCILAGVLFPSSLLKEIDYILGSSDTKKRRTTQYWNGLFLELDRMKRKGLIFLIEKIPPWHVDKYNVNKIMDVVYQRILSQLMREVKPKDCRIVLDDYGIGSNLLKYLDFLESQGAEIKVEIKADEKYAEVRLASVVAKREKEKVMEAINKTYAINGYSVGSGNANDPVTLKWIERWKETGKPWPWFVKQSFKPIGKPVKKMEPPIRHDLLSQDSKILFDEGKLSIESLNILCPHCGNILKSCKITPSEEGGLVGRCPNEDCNKIISNLNTTLLYYCGYIVPDSSVILAGVISMDLDTKRFFDGFTFVLLPEVRKECDSPGGKKEFEKLGNFASIGRINLIDFDTKKINYNGSLPKDEIIVNVAKKINAIIYTRDRGMYGTAISKNIFCLTK
jgi:ribonuclease HII